MAASYDVIVAGLGAMGSATIHQLARRGARVLGLDRYSPPHDAGSSHGKSRIIREAYFEDPLYVPLVQRAYQGWAALEHESGVSLLRQTGGLMFGPPDGALVRGARLSAETHALPHTVLTASDVRRRYPALTPREDMAAVFEPRAGVLAPELAIATALECAIRRGADVHRSEPLISWRPNSGGLSVTTAAATYHTGRLVLTLGAWTGALLASLALPLVVERNAVFWFEPARRREQFSPEVFPIFMCEYLPGHICYGFPDMGDGVKFAIHHHGEFCEPDTVRREIMPQEIAAIRSLTDQYLPDANGRLLGTTVCLYTNTPDEDFIIDAHPDDARVIVTSACSGHGFKFAPAVGEIVSDLAIGRRPEFDLTPFSLARLLGSKERGGRNETSQERG